MGPGGFTFFPFMMPMPGPNCTGEHPDRRARARLKIMTVIRAVANPNVRAVNFITNFVMNSINSNSGAMV